MKIFIFFAILISLSFYNRKKIFCKSADSLNVKIIDKYFDRVTDKFMITTNAGVFKFENTDCYPTDVKALYDFCKIDSSYNLKVVGNKNSKLSYRTVVNVENF
jgi:hypothetical protein